MSETAKRLAELKEEMARLEKQLVIEQNELVIKVTNYSSVTDKVEVESNYRLDFVEYLRTLPSRSWNGRINILNRHDTLSLYGDWIMGKIPNSQFYFQNEFSLSSLLLAERPADIIISFIESKNLFRVDLLPHVYADAISRIPGAHWDYVGKYYTIPISEGWRFYNVANGLVEKYQLEWKDNSLDIAVEQVKKRESLKTVRDLTDFEFDPPIVLNNGKDLRGFQKVGIAFGEATNGRWLCGDEMGLGKTWQAIAYAMKNNSKTLIVCPANLKINWMREVKDLTGKKGHWLSSEIPSVYDMAYMMMGKEEQFFIMNYDILATKKNLTTEITLPNGQKSIKNEEVWPWIDVIKKAKFDLIVFDEAHYVKNIDSLRSKAARMLVDIPNVMLATGTPIINRVDELWPLLNIINPMMFDSPGRFANQYSTDGRNVRNLSELKEILSTVMIRRLKKDVIEQMPPANDVFHWRALPPKAIRLYNKALQGMYEILTTFNPNAPEGASKEITNLLVKIMRLKQICSVSKIDDVAAIATELYDSGDTEEQNNKVIIFSQFKAVAKAIAARLGHEALSFTGEININERMKMVDEFQNNKDVHFLVMTTQVAAEGLNLTQAGHVIFADLGWTPKEHSQCIGRAYGRLSNLHGVDVHWIVYEKTVEDWILELLNAKRMLVGQVVDGKEVTGGESVAMELIKKIKEEMFKPKQLGDEDE